MFLLQILSIINWVCCNSGFSTGCMSLSRAWFLGPILESLRARPTCLVQAWRDRALTPWRISSWPLRQRIPESGISEEIQADCFFPYIDPGLPAVWGPSDQLRLFVLGFAIEIIGYYRMFVGEHTLAIWQLLQTLCGELVAHLLLHVSRKMMFLEC